MYGWAKAGTGETAGVAGNSSSTSGKGVYGNATTSSGETFGVYGESSSDVGTGVYGKGVVGVVGSSITLLGAGVRGYGTEVKNNFGTGVFGRGYYGVFGRSSPEELGFGVYGMADATGGKGVYGEATAESGITTGVYGESISTSGRGVIGDATSESGTTFGVVGYSASPAGYAGYFRNTSSGVGLYVQTDSGTGNIIEALSSFGEVEFRVARDGNVYADGTFTGGGADYAELLPASAGLQPGDVLVIGTDGKLTRSTTPSQTSVVGVYSTQPGFLAGAGEDGAVSEDQVPLAVMGVVPVKVTAENGPIQPGDLLTTSSTAGLAMRAGTDPPPGTVIGKALEAWETGSGVIQMLVMLR